MTTKPDQQADTGMAMSGSWLTGLRFFHVITKTVLSCILIFASGQNNPPVNQFSFLLSYLKLQNTHQIAQTTTSVHAKIETVIFSHSKICSMPDHPRGGGGFHNWYQLVQLSKLSQSSYQASPAHVIKTLSFICRLVAYVESACTQSENIGSNCEPHHPPQGASPTVRAHGSIQNSLNLVLPLTFLSIRTKPCDFADACSIKHY